MLGVHYFDGWIKATAAEGQFKVAIQRGHTAAQDRDWLVAGARHVMVIAPVTDQLPQRPAPEDPAPAVKKGTRK